MSTINMLIVDDHPLTCMGYRIFIDNATEEGKLPKFNIDEAHNAEHAYEKLQNIDKEKSKYHIILLDIQLPVSEKYKIFSGEDIGVLIRKLDPELKIIVQTVLSDNYRLYNIFKNLNPEGIIIKSDLDDAIFIQAIQNVLIDIPYYSKTFTKLIRNQFSREYIFDTEDRELLYLLSIGVPSKDIPSHIPWSLSKVEKRKKLLREKLGVDNKSVLALVNKAKEEGYL